MGQLTLGQWTKFRNPRRMIRTTKRFPKHHVSSVDFVLSFSAVASRGSCLSKATKKVPTDIQGHQQLGQPGQTEVVHVTANQGFCFDPKFPTSVHCIQSVHSSENRKRLQPSASSLRTSSSAKRKVKLYLGKGPTSETRPPSGWWLRAASVVWLRGGFPVTLYKNQGSEPNPVPNWLQTTDNHQPRVSCETQQTGRKRRTQNKNTKQKHARQQTARTPIRG